MSSCLFLPLYLAYRKARQKKKPSYNQLAFEAQLLDNLAILSHTLHTHTWRPQPYLSFVAIKPKARQIHAPDFGDRVVHHWLVPELEAVFEPKFIHDSYANRIGKGTNKAVERLQQFVRQLYSGKTGKTDPRLADGGKGYYLQCDIANFFNTIHRPTLQRLVTRHIDHLPSCVQSATHQLLTCSVADSGVRQRATPRQLNAVPDHKKLENAKPDCALPIGNLSSQFFANVYMNELDQYVKHTLKVKHYLRYVDDFILLSDNQAQLRQWQQQIEQFLHTQLHLTLKPSPICKPIITGIDFLGFVVFPHHTQVRRRVVANLRHKLYRLEQEQSSSAPSTKSAKSAQPTNQPYQIRQQTHHCSYFGQPCTDYYLYADVTGYHHLRSVYASYLGHIRHANHHRLLQKLYQDYPYLQCFAIKTRFDIDGWFEPRPIWLWQHLKPIHPNHHSKPYQPPISQETTHASPVPKNNSPMIQLCFDF